MSEFLLSDMSWGLYPRGDIKDTKVPFRIICLFAICHPYSHLQSQR